MYEALAAWSVTQEDFRQPQNLTMELCSEKTLYCQACSQQTQICVTHCFKCEFTASTGTKFLENASYLCRLVLCTNHPGGCLQRPVKACGWLVLTEQVKPMQPPVQGVRHNNGSHADVSMNLHVIVTT